MRKRLTTDEFIKKAKSIHTNKYDYSLVDYKESKIKIKIICSTHGCFSQRPSNHLSGYGCIKCGKSLITKTTKEFIDESKILHLNKYNYSLVNYNGAFNGVLIICDEHGVFKQRPDHHLAGSGCPKCVNRNKSTSEIISEFKQTHGKLYNYSQVEYKGALNKVKIICKNHGVFQQTPDKHRQGNGCPGCKTSKGEVKVKDFLILENIIFKHQHKFNDCKNILPLPFDFYLPTHNLCIEYNGIQHYEPIEFFGGVKSFNSQKERDKIKKDYCKNNNIELLEIKYNQNINKILNKVLIN